MDNPQNSEDLQNLTGAAAELLLDLFSGQEKDLSLKETLAVAVIGKRKYIRISDLASALRLPLTTASSLVDRMAARGLFRRSRFEDERRIVAVSLTETGEKIFENQKKRQVEWVENRLSRFSAEENATFLRLLSVFVQD